VICLKALRTFRSARSLLGVLGDYFKEDKLKLSFTFQSKYLGHRRGKSGRVRHLPYSRHAFGVYHVWASLAKSRGDGEGVPRTRREPAAWQPVNSCARRPPGARSGIGGRRKVLADETVLNADFGTP